ncbi:MAG: penicillin acylase family protein [Hyphomicrobiaceae bacterium]|nr:penicillin acylase family protein [Hyphomicrobiaceae bacterium]
MARVLTWIWRIAAGLVVLVLLLAWSAYFAARNTVPAASGALAARGLAGPVRLVRDREGVPHVFAKSLDDVLFGIGFAHAQDRLWQMELQRRAVAGRLSEMLGQRTLTTDILMRTLDLRGYAERAVSHLPEAARRQLEAYARGVNAYLERRTGLLEPRWPIELMLLGVTPEPWTVADTVSIVKLMALNLSTNLGAETLRLALAAQGLTPAEITDLMPPDAAVAPPPLPDLGALYPIRKTGPAKHAAIPMIGAMIGDGASNNWVVAGAKTKSGKPLLANDPHLRLSAPSIWYLAHYALEQDGGRQMNAVGATLPGVPHIVIGRSDTLAWGFTNTGADVQDLFVEKLNPDNPKEYLTPEGWRAFETARVAIKVRGGAEHVIERRWTRHGPVMPDFFRGLGAALGPGYVAALGWTALVDDDATVSAGLDWQHARSVEDFFALMAPYQVPMQSMVVADTEGNIGLIAPGTVPVRDPANAVAGRAPVPGWDAVYDWKGFIPADRLPRTQNPPAGAIGTSNARMVPPDYPFLLTNDWDPPFRQQRLERLILERGEHDIESMKAAQADVLSPAVERLQALMIAAAQAGAGVDNGMLDQLTAWDGRQRADAAEPLIYAAWVREAVRGIFADELGGAFELYFGGRAAALIGVLEGKAKGRDWCDDRRTKEHESCAQVLADALSRALKGLEARFGPDRAKWRWGQAHAALAEHRPFGLVPYLAPFFDVVVPSPGGDDTLNRGMMEYGGEQPFANRHASSFRGIYDLSNLDRSLYMHTTGQSGNPLSPHYRSLAERWARVEYIEIPTRAEAIAATAAGTWVLTPAP